MGRIRRSQKPGGAIGAARPAPAAKRPPKFHRKWRRGPLPTSPPSKWEWQSRSRWVQYKASPMAKASRRHKRTFSQLLGSLVPVLAPADLDLQLVLQPDPAPRDARQGPSRDGRGSVAAQRTVPPPEARPPATPARPTPRVHPYRRPADKPRAWTKAPHQGWLPPIAVASAHPSTASAPAGPAQPPLGVPTAPTTPGLRSEAAAVGDEERGQAASPAASSSAVATPNSAATPSTPAQHGGAPASPSPTGRLRVSVGGRRFHTTRAVLTQVPGSRLASLFTAGSPDCAAPADCADFDFVIDRDGAYFQTLLLWLRTGEVDGPLPDDERQWLLREAQWYGLGQLAAALDPQPAPHQLAAEFCCRGWECLSVEPDELRLPAGQAFSVACWLTLDADSLGDGHRCAERVVFHRGAGRRAFPCLVIRGHCLRLCWPCLPDTAVPSGCLFEEDPRPPEDSFGSQPSFEELEFEDLSPTSRSPSPPCETAFPVLRLQPRRCHHVALTYDSTRRTCCIYLDGSQCSRSTLPASLDALPEGPLHFGASRDLRLPGFQGTLRDVYLHLSTLDPPAIRALAATPPPDPSGPSIAPSRLAAAPAAVDSTLLVWEPAAP